MSSSLESSSAPSNSSMRGQMESWIRFLQEDIVQALEKLDSNAPKFQRDSWVRPEGGMGQSCVFAAPTSSGEQKEFILEKAGVNISIVHGTLPPPAIKQMRADHTSMPLPEDAPGGLPFFAAGISLVIHPKNPHAPTCHANYRYFEITDPASAAAGADVAPKTLAWWFGGGSDLTPSYLYPADATHFHQTHKSACDAFSPSFYPALKKWCDEYFYIPHRSESRGIGGIFFDDLHAGPHARLPDNPSDHPRTLASIFVFVKSLGAAFVPAYIPIVEQRAKTPYTDEQRRWQLIRRGRYVEFNLVVDRGTKFGLMTPGARVESILMSLPETARWEYMSEMGADEETEEGKLIRVLKEPKEWV
ncbi:coproporphyrinogen III oxidase [Lentinula lateritia]|uniref:Coproporphyrinogen III oxidase n=1 Tax=Lentinula aff. lateritia TaxID=2804960 RepID=A0ACC1TLH1_9AGAR|nr:coproporphyrinogen III oxidase [Lentinula aff. lateritia]KAJ3847408.1 coproporphyrinogen III oxidase [Lentinula lateritia]